MKPLDLHEYLNNHLTDFVTDCVLEVIEQIEPITVQRIVEKCSIMGVSSPATTFKRIRYLKARGDIREYKHPTDKDTRKTYLMITEKGKDRLKRWGK